MNVMQHQHPIIDNLAKLYYICDNLIQ